MGILAIENSKHWLFKCLMRKLDECLKLNNKGLLVNVEDSKVPLMEDYFDPGGASSMKRGFSFPLVNKNIADMHFFRNISFTFLEITNTSVLANLKQATFFTTKTWYYYTMGIYIFHKETVGN